jgi:predicted nucleotidyltransferase component of viral defense system
MNINSPKQLKDWISNITKQNNLVANTLLQNYMMERFLERILVSQYKDNFILKGGFLIAAMVGIDLRSTMDMDTTIKGLPVDKESIERVLNEILSIDVGDNVTFAIKSVRNIHDVSNYDDYRIGIEAMFFNMRVNMKVDITTGDVIIPREIRYCFKLMFEDRYIEVMAYNLNTILAEKIESILSRNISNTRARDFYDVYILLTTRASDINKDELKLAINKKAEERNSIIYVDNYKKYLTDISESDDVQKIWDNYQTKYIYAKDISFNNTINCIKEVLE